MQWPLVGREAALDHGLELVESGTGVALLGSAGVGKSRLLHEVADRAEKSGKTVVRTVASVSTRSIPFAPFVELLPGGPTHDRLAMLGSARESLVSSAGSRGLMVAVDDAHHLDDTSLAFLISIVAAGIATVALTARTGEQMQTDLVDLWTNGVIERLDMGPLKRNDAARLLEARLGSVSPALEEELWHLAAGNPLVLHELIEGAVGEAIEQDENGVWVSTGPLAGSARLSDLVGSRLRALPDDVRPGMDLVSLGSPLPIDLASRALGDTLVRLEEMSLVTVVGTGAERALVPAHPLYGELLKAHIGDARSRTAYRRLVEASADGPAETDPVRVALWQLECGDLLSTEVAIAGAQEALIRHEPALAEHLLRPLGTEDDAVALLIGRALSYRQRFDEAEAILTGRSPGDEALMGEIASIRAQNMGFGLGRVNEAREMLHDAAERTSDPDLRARLINERAMVSAIHGDFVDSMASSEQVLSDPETSVVSRAAAYVTLTVALAMTGDCDRMDEIIDDAIETSTAARDVLPFSRDQIGVMQASSAMHAGRLEEADSLVVEALANSVRGNALTTTWLSASVINHELAGRLRDAKAAASDALEMYAEADPFGLEAQTRGLLALSSGLMGEPSSEELFELDHPQAGPRLTLWLARGRAWSSAARGDLDGAAEAARRGGLAAIDGEHYAWALFAFTDVVRFGQGDSVIEEIREVDTSKGAHFLEVLTQHAEAMVAAEPRELELVARRFVDLGTWLLAAETFSRVAALQQDKGEKIEASRAAALSMYAENLCQDPSTPALISRPALVSPREFDVALDAVSGMTSPEISEKRYISVRTVDNHLSSVYRKLGLSGRDELSTFFDMG